MHDLCLFDFHGSHYPLSHPSLSDLNVNPERNLLCDVKEGEGGRGRRMGPFRLLLSSLVKIEIISIVLVRDL